MQGVGEPDEEQEAGYPQQHLQLCPPSAPPSELHGAVGWVITPGVARLKICHTLTVDLTSPANVGSIQVTADQTLAISAAGEEVEIVQEILTETITTPR